MTRSWCEASDYGKVLSDRGAQHQVQQPNLFINPQVLDFYWSLFFVTTIPNSRKHLVLLHFRSLSTS